MFRYLFSILSLLFIVTSPCIGDIASSGYVDEMRDNVQSKIDKKAANSNYTQNSVLQTDTLGNVVATMAGTDLFADGSIETMHLADGAVTNADLAGMIDITKLNLGTLPTSGKHIMIWNATTNEYVFEKLNNGLPDGYTRLEYIESTGTQYIDTGLSVNDYDSAKAEVALTSYTGYYLELLGISASSGARDARTFRLYDKDDISGGAKIGYSDKWIGSNYRLNLNTFVEIEFKAAPYNQYVKVNGEVKVETNYSAPTTFTNRGNATIFAHNYAGSVKWFVREKLKYLSVLKDDVVVRNFIPAKNSSGVIGMYDTVTKNFFTNKGTGSFIAGPEM